MDPWTSTHGGALLAAAVLLPFVGMLLGLVLGGRHVQRVAFVLIWSPPLGIALRADGPAVGGALNLVFVSGDLFTLYVALELLIVLRSLDRQLEIAQRTARNFQDTLRIFELRFRSGLVAKTELTQIRSQVQQALAAIPAFSGTIRGNPSTGCLTSRLSPTAHSRVRYRAQGAAHIIRSVSVIRRPCNVWEACRAFDHHQSRSKHL